jgi:hypothetical protein
MTYTSAAMSEIARVAWWSLRALGCPVGAVERMAKVLAFSEVLEGGCLRALRRDEASLIATFHGVEPRFVLQGKQSGTVEASGRSFLDIGPRTVDLLTGMVKQHDQAVQIRVSGASDRLALAGACVLAAQRGVGIMAVLPPESGRRAWHYYAGPSSSLESISGIVTGGHAALFELFAELTGTDLASSEFPASLESDDASIDLIATAHPVRSELRAYADAKTDIVWTDVAGALQTAYADGVKVTPEDLKFLYELETRTWAPSSDRSRMQAGFGTPAPAA